MPEIVPGHVYSPVPSPTTPVSQLSSLSPSASPFVPGATSTFTQVPSFPYPQSANPSLSSQFPLGTPHPSAKGVVGPPTSPLSTLPLCLSACLPLCMSASVSASQFVRQSTPQSSLSSDLFSRLLLCQVTCLSACLTVCQVICLSVGLFQLVPMCLSMCLSACLSVCLPSCLSV